MMHMSLLHGWVPWLVALGGWGALVAGVAWQRRPAWHWVVIGAIAGVAAVVTAWMLDIPARVGSTYPRSFLAWGALPLFAIGALVWQWARVGWWRRAVSALAVPLLVLFGALQINAHYGYLPTVGDALGARLPGEVSTHQLEAMRTHGTGQRGRARSVHLLPSKGVVVHLDIPATVSGFSHRDGYVWLPPVWFEHPRPRLPVLMLLSGTPGTPGDWMRGGGALQLANAWAASHHGDAPVMVAPDINGSVTGDTECVGAAETYLTVDVRDFMHSRFGVALSRQEWALAGMSEGGTCALVLTTTHPDLFGSFADFMGDEAPSVGTFHHTLVALFGGSYDAWLAHDPTTWFGRDAADGLEGYIAVGSRDRGYFKRERRVAEMARADHLVVTFEIIRGGTHSWPTASHAMRDAYPWLVARVEGAELTRA